MSTKGYKQLAQEPDHDLSLETDQEEQPNEDEHCSERVSLTKDSSNPADEESDPSTASSENPTTTTATTTSGTILSFEMDLGEPLVADTPISRFRRTLFGKKRTLLVGCVAVLLGIVTLWLTVMTFRRHNPTTLSPRETLTQLVQTRISSISFDSSTSPESKALDWMVNVDEFDHTAVSDDRLVQRFAVVAMVYSMGLTGEMDLLTSESVCMWDVRGYPIISCDDDQRLVRFTGVGKLGLQAPSLPVAVGLLTDLTDMSLRDNKLTGTIPNEIGLLSGLTVLGLGGNHLSGTIPTEIGLLTRLAVLYPYKNQFTGTTPTEIGLMTSLCWLGLDNNHLTGSIPTEIGLLTGVTLLSLRDNQLTGSIPTEIGLLTGLTSLNLLGNQLSGSLPTEIGLLTSLTWMNLNSNELSGFIPTEFGLMTSLTELHLYSNKVTGSIPASSCSPGDDFRIDCDKITCSCCKDNARHHCPGN